MNKFIRISTMFMVGFVLIFDAIFLFRPDTLSFQNMVAFNLFTIVSLLCDIWLDNVKIFDGEDDE